MSVTRCACGLPLHYNSAQVAAGVKLLVDRYGEHVTVACGGQEYVVQRHFIALHGLKAKDLPWLLERGIVSKANG